jgi:hypothetical protein
MDEERKDKKEKKAAYDLAAYGGLYLARPCFALLG